MREIVARGWQRMTLAWHKQSISADKAHSYALVRAVGRLFLPLIVESTRRSIPKWDGAKEKASSTNGSLSTPDRSYTGYFARRNIDTPSADFTISRSFRPPFLYPLFQIRITSMGARHVIISSYGRRRSLYVYTCALSQWNLCNVAPCDYSAAKPARRCIFYHPRSAQRH